MKKSRRYFLLCMIAIAVALAGCGRTSGAAADQKETQQSGTAGETEKETGDALTAKEEQTTEDALTVATGSSTVPESSENVPTAETGAPDEAAQQETKPAAPSYTYDELSGVMYAVQAVNVRDQPSTAGGKIGSLSTGQEVTVTGQCRETSWYRIEYRGQTGYVSNRYLTKEKPEERPAAAQTAPQETPPSALQQTETAQYPGLVPIGQLANRKSLQKKCSDQEFQAAYDAAAQIVLPLVGMSREDQLFGIADALRAMYDSGQVTYSTEAPHYNDPYGYLVAGVASCAGCARTTGLCLNMLGIPYEHVNENLWTHQWCRVEVNGVYWICDAYGLCVGPEPAPYMHPMLY